MQCLREFWAFEVSVSLKRGSVSLLQFLVFNVILRFFFNVELLNQVASVKLQEVLITNQIKIHPKICTYM